MIGTNCFNNIFDKKNYHKDMIINAMKFCDNNITFFLM